ncbi:MAG: metal ABC transporter solute-binding protein, Zn/Mn family [Bacteroidales bacterium]
MRDAIIGEYPELEETVIGNYQKLFSQINELHNQWETLSLQLTHDTFMIFHPALTYLARDYGFTQVPVERGGKEPSPATLRRIIDMARNRDIPVIFIQQEFDVRSAQLISEESGAELVQINPLAYSWQEEMEHLLEIFNNHLQ